MKEKKAKEQKNSYKNLWGYNNIQVLAEELYSSVHRDLLAGALVFGYRGDGNLKRLVITQRQDNLDHYMVGAVYSSYSMFIPRVPVDYVLNDVILDMSSNKIDKEITNSLLQIYGKL